VSRQTVRAAVAGYFGGRQISAHAYAGIEGVPLLGTVFTAPPKEWSEDDAFAGQPAGGRSGAVAIVRILTQQETRVTVGAPVGIKRIGYGVVLDCYHISHATDAGDAVDDLDAFCDATEAWLRADPTLAGAVFLAGEGDRLGVSGGRGYVSWEFSEPSGADERTETFASLGFPIIEHVTG
jgi:hypothetical protein